MHILKPTVLLFALPLSAVSCNTEREAGTEARNDRVSEGVEARFRNSRLVSSSIFENQEDVDGAIASAESGDQQSMALLEEHYKLTYHIEKAIYWQDRLIEGGSVMAMKRKATLLSAMYGPERCQEVIALLERAVATAKTPDEKKSASSFLSSMKGEFNPRSSCVNRAGAQGPQN